MSKALGAKGTQRINEEKTKSRGVVNIDYLTINEKCYQ